MRKIKTDTGITLIALIITIVVLLILAVVAIGQAQETNIVGYAQNAATKYEQAQNNEVGLLSEYENKIEEIINVSEKYPKVYSLDIRNNQKMYFIQTGEDDGVVVGIKGTEQIYVFKAKIQECSNFRTIPEFAQADIITNGYEYSKLVTSDIGGLVYANNINKWIFISITFKTNSSSEIAKVEIKSDMIAQDDKNLTQEQINAYIEAAK